MLDGSELMSSVTTFVRWSALKNHGRGRLVYGASQLRYTPKNRILTLLVVFNESKASKE